MNCGHAKIRSVHTYVIPWIHWFEPNCTLRTVQYSTNIWNWFEIGNQLIRCHQRFVHWMPSYGIFCIYFMLISYFVLLNHGKSIDSTSRKQPYLVESRKAQEKPVLGIALLCNIYNMTHQKPSFLKKTKCEWSFILESRISFYG